MEKSEMRSLCELIGSKGATTVPEHESKRIVQGYGVSVPEGTIVASAEAAVRFADRVGYPVVLKAVSSEMLHKTEQKGVVINLNSSEELKRACEEMADVFSGRGEMVEGYLIEKMVQGGAEFIVGLQDDPYFGPVIMLGTGGVFIHLMDDITFRVLPVTREDVLEMIEEIRKEELSKLDVQPRGDIANSRKS